MADQLRPTIGRIVIYRSRTGYTCPAIITATRETLIHANVVKGYISDLSEASNVHLTVFTPGKPGSGPRKYGWWWRRRQGAQRNTSGLYQEWDVPKSKRLNGSGEQEPRTWKWPDRV